MSGQAKSQIALSQKPLEGLWLLVVDDNVQHLRLYQRWLERAGAQVAIEENGQEAIKTLAAHPRVFDAVIMDQQMPIMDGIEATRHLHGAVGYLGAILGITAFDGPGIRENWTMAGCDGFVVKPFPIETLFQQLRLAIHRSRMSCQVVGG